MSTPIEQRNKCLGEKVVKSLNARHFEAYYCADSTVALDKALELIPKGDTVAWGGSMTIRDIGLTKALYEGDYTVLDRDITDIPAEKEEIARKSLLADTYITSSNAVSEDGQLVNIDGYGNRVAAMIFGPKSVVVIVGINKIVKTADDAMKRARNIAAPINVQRFPSKKTPCMITGSCENCISDDCICAYMVTTRVSNPHKKIKVIIVGEELGY